MLRVPCCTVARKKFCPSFILHSRCLFNANRVSKQPSNRGQQKMHKTQVFTVNDCVGKYKLSRSVPLLDWFAVPFVTFLKKDERKAFGNTIELEGRFMKTVLFIIDLFSIGLPPPAHCWNIPNPFGHFEERRRRRRSKFSPSCSFSVETPDVSRGKRKNLKTNFPFRKRESESSASSSSSFPREEGILFDHR